MKDEIKYINFPKLYVRKFYLIKLDVVSIEGICHIVANLDIKRLY